MHLRKKGWLVTVEQVYGNSAPGKGWETVRSFVARYFARGLTEALKEAEGDRALPEVKHVKAKLRRRGKN